MYSFLVNVVAFVAFVGFAYVMYRMFKGDSIQEIYSEGRGFLLKVKSFFKKDSE